MSFQMLKNEVIDPGLCQGCGLCAGLCKHIDIETLRPTLKDFCMLEKEGIDCGKCYQSCPQVLQKKFKEKEPLGIYALRSKDPEILKRASSGGFVTTIVKNLIEEEVLDQIVMVQNTEDMAVAEKVSDPNEVVSKAGVIYGRSGVLEKLVELTGEVSESIGIVGVPCEMRGAADVEEKTKGDIFKIGLFCNSAIRTEQTDEGIICSPCSDGCPAGVDAQGYIAHIRNGDYLTAVDLVRENNPLPSVCGRVCTNECEHGCMLIGADHPVAIRELKKFITEWEIENSDRKNMRMKRIKEEAQKIAIIGAGPAGLTAAYYLAKRGYKPVIFEKSDQTGGMLRFGVPQFRLPNYVLDYDVEMIKKMGVEIILNKPLGPDMTIEDLKKDGYEAIFIATGQYKPRTLHLEGEDLPNVHVAIEFLIDRKYRYWESKEEFKGKIVGIIGGGSVAVDVAQTALRLSAEKVHLVDIMTEEQLELVLREVPEDEYEHMEYHFTTSTSKITKNKDGKLVLNCYKVKWEPDDKGIQQLIKVKDSEYEIPVDSIVIAIGQAVDFELIDDATEHILEKERGKIVVNEVTFETNIPGVFAGGDIIYNSKAVAIAAIAHGNEAAISIDRYLKGKDLMAGRYKRNKTFFIGPKKPPKDYSQKPEAWEEVEEQRVWSFDEIDALFDEETALQEARRCLNCNKFCAYCQDFPAIYSDFTAGDIGSEPGFTTVVVWTPRGKEVVDRAIEKGLFKQGDVIEEEIQKAINLKAKRPLKIFEKTPRQKVLYYITLQGPSTIEDMTKNLNIDAKKIRYEALRLVQLNKLEMKVLPNIVDPIFSIKAE